MATKARAQSVLSAANQHAMCYIDLDSNNDYGIFLESSHDYGETWSEPKKIVEGVAITSFHAFFDVLNRLNIYYSKVVNGQIKEYYVTTPDLGETVSEETEVT